MKIKTPFFGIDLDRQTMLILGGLVVGGAILSAYTAKQAGAAALAAVNPIDENNVINQGFTWSVREIFGLPENWTLGNSFETPAEKAEIWDPDLGWIPNPDFR